MINEWRELEGLLGLRGEAYAHQRDLLVGDRAGLREHLAAWEASVDWQRRTQGLILRGWSEHAALYRRVVRELDAVDIASMEGMVSGITAVWREYAGNARYDYHEAILPLCWEVLLKFGDTWPAWKVRTFLEMISAVPHAASVQPVFFYMQEIAPLDRLGGPTNTLRDLPPAAVLPMLVVRLAQIEAMLHAGLPLDLRTTELLRIWQLIQWETAHKP